MKYALANQLKGLNRAIIKVNAYNFSLKDDPESKVSPICKTLIYKLIS